MSILGSLSGLMAPSWVAIGSLYHCPVLTRCLSHCIYSQPSSALSIVACLCTSAMLMPAHPCPNFIRFPCVIGIVVQLASCQTNLRVSYGFLWAMRSSLFQYFVNMCPLFTQSTCAPCRSESERSVPKLAQSNSLMPL